MTHPYFRPGTRVYRTVYRHITPTDTKGELVGLLDTPELATHATVGLNDTCWPPTPGEPEAIATLHPALRTLTHAADRLCDEFIEAAPPGQHLSARQHELLHQLTHTVEATWHRHTRQQPTDPPQEQR